MTSRPESFGRTAVAITPSDGGFPSEIYILQLASVQARYARFLHCVEDASARSLSDPEFARNRLSAGLLLPRYRFTGRILDACAVPIDADLDAIILCLGVRWLGPAVAPMRYTPLEDHIASLHALPGRGHAAGARRETQPRVQKSIRNAMMEEFPWLTDEDFGLIAKRIRGWDGGGGPSREMGALEPPGPGGASEDEPDDDVMEVHRHMDAGGEHDAEDELPLQILRLVFISMYVLGPTRKRTDYWVLWTGSPTACSAEPKLRFGVLGRVLHRRRHLTSPRTALKAVFF